MAKSRGRAKYFGSKRRLPIGELSPDVERPPSIDPQRNVESAWQWLEAMGELGEHAKPANAKLI